MADIVWTLRQSVSVLLNGSVIPATPGLCQEDHEFKASIASTAKTLEMETQGGGVRGVLTTQVWLSGFSLPHPHKKQSAAVYVCSPV